MPKTSILDQMKADKEMLKHDLAKRIKEFEDAYGQDTVQNIRIRRWNGSNEAFGKVVGVDVDVRV